MANLPIYGFGGLGANQVIYGFASGPSVPKLTPARGLILGGDIFTIANTNISNSNYIDIFSGTVLDTSKWTDISSGGAITVNDALILSIPASGGQAGVCTNSQYKNFDISIDYQYNNSIENVYPSTTITFISLVARIDSQNYFTVAHIWDPTKGAVIQVTVTINGGTIYLLSQPIKSSIRSLRLVRYLGRIQSYVGGMLLVDYTGWSDILLTIEIASASGSLPTNLRTIVSKYMPAILVTFGSEICPAAQQVGDHIVGSTPPTKIPTFVDVLIHSISTTTSLGPSSFEYYAPLQLTISNNNTSVIIANDNTLRDSTSELKGLRL